MIVCWFYYCLSFGTIYGEYLRNHSIGVWQIRIQASNLSLMKNLGENGYKFVERKTNNVLKSLDR